MGSGSSGSLEGQNKVTITDPKKRTRIGITSLSFRRIWTNLTEWQSDLSARSYATGRLSR